MHEPDLDIEVQAHGPRMVLMLNGELDVATAGTLRACFESIDHGFRHVILDLTGLTFLDSSGVGLIAETHRRFEPEMRSLTLHNPTGHVANVVEMRGLQTVMPVTDIADGNGSPPTRL